MVEVSNRLLILLLLVAISIAALGTIIGLNNLVGLPGGGLWLSGAASSTATGDVNLTITAVTALTNQRSQIDFGSGFVNASCNFCGMDSNGQNISYYANGSNLSGIGGAPNSQCCVGFNSTQGVGFLLENTGNVNISVGYTCSGNCTFDLFIGGNRAPGMGGLEIKVTPNSADSQIGETGVTDTAGSCQGGGSGAGIAGHNSWNITNSTSYTNTNVYGRFGNSTYAFLSPAGHWLCGNATQYLLDSDNTKDAAVVDINITIPISAPATGVRSSFRLTFNGTSAS